MPMVVPIIIAGIGHLAVVADIDPGVGEQVLHLQVEDFLIDIDVAVDFGLAHKVMNSCGVAIVFAHALFSYSRSANLQLVYRSSTSRGGLCPRHANLHDLVAGALVLAEDMIAMIGLAFEHSDLANAAFAALTIVHADQSLHRSAPAECSSPVAP